MAIRKLNFKFHNLKLHVWLTFLLGIAGLEDGWNGFEKKDEMITARPSKRLIQVRGESQLAFWQ